MRTFDVIVIGGGPAGSVAACCCARDGFSVALFEHHTFPRHKVCGDTINPACWPVFERLDVADSIRKLPHHAITAAQFTTPDGAILDVPIRAHSIQRSQLDTALLHRAQQCGATIFEGEAVRVLPSSTEVQTSAGTYRARRALIGADGRNSIVAKQLGLKSRTPTSPHIAYQAHFRAPPSMNDAVQLHMFPGGYCGVVRIDADHVNLCIVTDRHRTDCESLFDRTVRLNRHFCALGIAPEPVTALHSAHPLVTGMNTAQRGRVWLVGDALRTTEPFTGQGIYFALHTGMLAAQTIVAGNSYAAAVSQLYARRGHTNALLRRLMYRHDLASPVLHALQRCPSALRWLADNVLAEGPVPSTIALQ